MRQHTRHRPRACSSARDAARLARVLSLRTGDAKRLGQARALLIEASRRKAIEGACPAALSLSRLEARDLNRPNEGYLVAYRTARRFEALRGAERCVAEARRMTAILAPFAPPPEQLAAIDADPDADDPSAGLAPSTSAAEDVAAWAKGRHDVGGATLQHIAVYGGGDQDTGAQHPTRPDAVVRIVLGFDRVALFDRGDLPAEGALPRRAYLDLASVTASHDVPASVAVDAAGVRRVRIGHPDGGHLRVVFDLEPDAAYHLFFLTDPYRVVLDFHRTGTASPSPAPVAKRSRVHTIVIDPGHGGHDFGAQYEGLKEAQIAFDLAGRVANELRQRLSGVRVLLTRHGDDYVSLEQRAAVANAVDADLFVSIHLNASDDPVARGGVATFVLDTSNDWQALRLAARENGTSTSEVSGLSRILAHLYRDAQGAASRRLAAGIEGATLAQARRFVPTLMDRGVKSAMFYVLVGARMPAVLVEASFLTEPKEARLLHTDRYRQALADGIAQGIVRYATREAPAAP